MALLVLGRVEMPPDFADTARMPNCRYCAAELPRSPIAGLNLGPAHSTWKTGRRGGGHHDGTVMYDERDGKYDDDPQESRGSGEPCSVLHGSVAFPRSGKKFTLLCICAPAWRPPPNRPIPSPSRKRSPRHARDLGRARAGKLLAYLRIMTERKSYTPCLLAALMVPRTVIVSSFRQRLSKQWLPCSWVCSIVHNERRDTLV